MKTAFIPEVIDGFSSIGQFAILKIDSVNWEKEYPYKPEVKAYVAHSKTSILIRFYVREENAKAVTLENNGPVWEDSCVEFFVKVPGSKYYFNFETNCIGAGLSAKRLSRTEFTFFTPEQMERVKKVSSLPKKACDIKGESEWTLDIEIPFDLIDCNECPKELLSNFYKCGDKTDKPHYLSWNPIDLPKPDFHRPEFFGKLVLE